MRYAVVAAAITVLAFAAGSAAYVLTKPERTVVAAIAVEPVRERPPKVEITKVQKPVRKPVQKPAKKKARVTKPRISGSSGGGASTLSPVVPAGAGGGASTLSPVVPAGDNVPAGSNDDPGVVTDDDGREDESRDDDGGDD
jgi:hypothetical protein